MPSLQLERHYHDIRQFLWQFINGNAAPHLWYNSMMLQFAVLMPIFWGLHLWLHHQKWKGWVTLFLTAILYFMWLLFYDHYVFHGPQSKYWYLLDRIFISFIIYAIYGVLAWDFRKYFNRQVAKFWPLLLILLATMFVKNNHDLRHFGWPINLNNATYYKVSMTVYSLTVICLVATLALYNQRHDNSAIQNIMHNLADLAYRAYLSNVFFERIIWYWIGSGHLKAHPYQAVIILWVLTWIVSFSCAYCTRMIVKKFRKLRRNP